MLPNVYSLYKLLAQGEEPALQNQFQEHVITMENENLKHDYDQSRHPPPVSSSGEPERPTEVPRGNEEAEESADPTLSPGKRENGRSMGRYFEKVDSGNWKESCQ